jgi:hypothetical protein
MLDMVILPPVRGQVTRMLVPFMIHRTVLLRAQNWVNNCAKVISRMKGIVISLTMKLQLRGSNQPRLAAVFMDVAAHGKKVS